jgi:RNA polymerase sigma-70 factor (ECF subfamily)
LESQAEFAKQLTIRIGEGDAIAESELVERYATGIKLMLYKRTGNRQVSLDLCQDTFIVALQKLRAGEVRNPESLAAFLRQTAVNLLIEHFRKERRYVSQEDGIISLQTAPRDRKAEWIDHQHARTLLDGVIEQLAQLRDREILRRFYLLDQDKARICDALKLSAAHFDRVLYRARKRMCEMIEQQPGLKSLLYGTLCDD